MLTKLWKLAGGSQSPVKNVGNVNETSKMLETVTAEDIIATTPLNLSTLEPAAEPALPRVRTIELIYLKS
jgi:hypothetical protein